MCSADCVGDLNGNSDIEVKLLCGADVLESFAVPNLWKPEHVSVLLLSTHSAAQPLIE